VKVLLDIDGVMIPAKSWQSYEIGLDGFGLFNKMAVDNLNKIITSCIDLEIILTTSHKQRFTSDEWMSIFQSRGVIASKISKLNTNSLAMTRKDEVYSWYLKNPNETFIVIDDDKGLNSLDSDFKEDHLILTNSTVGLNSLATDEALLKITNLTPNSKSLY
jgi:ATP-dependent helicase/DNAse subunit B